MLSSYEQLGGEMSDAQQATNPNASGTPMPVVDPASPGQIKTMGFSFLIFAGLLFYLLIATWPVPELGGNSAKAVVGFKSFRLFGLWCDWAPDRQMLFAVMAAGALGSLAHMLTSFGDYVGNRELSTNWIWWFVLRLPIGIALAVLFYFVIRGGLLIPTVQTQAPTNTLESTLLLNPYSIAAFSALAGMFSKQATDKIGEVFDAAFALKRKVEREGALGSTQPIKVAPPKLTKGKREDLTITGSGFETGTTAAIKNKARVFTRLSATQGKVAILDEDVKEVGKLELVITNPNGDVFKATVEVVEPGAAPSATKPVITDLAPIKVPQSNQAPLSINGHGFQIGCKALVGDNKERVTEWVSDTLAKVTLVAEDVATVGATLSLVIKNPDGQSSAPVAIKVE
jgi:hypothetical protein